MTCTDKYKNAEYFEAYIDEQKKRISKFKQMLNECEDTKKEKLCLFLSGLLKDLIAAQFSNNDDLSTIVSSFYEYSECLKVVGVSSYSEYIDYLSLIIVLGEKNVCINAPDEYDDDLTRILTNYIFEENKVLNGQRNFSEYYSAFIEYATGNSDFEELIEYVNKEWLTSSADFYWYESHMRDDNTYTGYWCYVASALIRIRGELEKATGDEQFIV